MNFGWDLLVWGGFEVRNWTKCSIILDFNFMCLSFPPCCSMSLKWALQYFNNIPNPPGPFTVSLNPPHFTNWPQNLNYCPHPSNPKLTTNRIQSSSENRTNNRKLKWKKSRTWTYSSSIITHSNLCFVYASLFITLWHLFCWYFFCCVMKMKMKFRIDE